jgi:predicted ferric reductase
MEAGRPQVRSFQRSHHTLGDPVKAANERPRLVNATRQADNCCGVTGHDTNAVALHDPRDRLGYSLPLLCFRLGPLFALLAGRLPPARDFWTEFSVALGYTGLAIMGLQFGITARFRYVTEPWGEDVIYHFHRQISLLAVGLVFVHPLIMFAIQPELLAVPHYSEVPLGAVFAFVSIFSLFALVVTALWRAKLKIPYELWHVTHIALAIAAVTGGLLHMVGWSFYLVNPWKRSLWIGLTIFWIGLLVYVRIVKPLLMLRRPYRVLAPGRGLRGRHRNAAFP